MRHATVWAIQEFINGYTDLVLGWPSNIAACSWTPCSGHAFGVESAYALINNNMPVQLLPDCPQCAVLLDLAIQLREESKSIL